MTVKITGLNEITSKLARLEDPSALRVPMQEAVQHVHDKIAVYPRKAPGAFSAMATPAQKRAYWARVRAGQIEHGEMGYKRTATLGRSWTTTVNANGTRGEVGTNTPYAVYVQGGKQQPFHKASGFLTTKAVAISEKDTVIGFFEDELNRRINK